jgi:hypothetical protein
MKRSDAKNIADIITDEQIKQMLNRAKEEVKDWTRPSKDNKGLSRGSHWNIICKGFENITTFSHIHKYRIIREYNEFLPDEIKQKFTKKQVIIQKPIHHDPIF